MERSVVRETVAGVILRGIVATIGVEKAFDILAELENEEKGLHVQPIATGYYEVKDAKKVISTHKTEEAAHEKLKRLRGERGMSQKDVADIIGISRSTYTVIENGYKSQKCKVREHLKKLEEYLRDNPVTAPAPVAPIADEKPSLSYTVTRKRKYPKRTQEEMVRVAREAILKHLSTDGEMKVPFLEGLCTLEEFKPMSYKEMWIAERELREEGFICQEKRATKDGERLFLFKPSDEKKFPVHEIVKVDKPELSETAKAAIAPEVKPLRKEILMESSERAAEIILENLSRHREEGLPKEHAVALCMFENISHGVARETISLLTGRGILGFRMGDNNGKNVPFIYLTQKGKEGK